MGVGGTFIAPVAGVSNFARLGAGAVRQDVRGVVAVSRVGHLNARWSKAGGLGAWTRARALAGRVDDAGIVARLGVGVLGAGRAFADGRIVARALAGRVDDADAVACLGVGKLAAWAGGWTGAVAFARDWVEFAGV